MKTPAKMKCECGGTAVRRVISTTLPISGEMVKVENIESLFCEDCGEKSFDGPTIVWLGRQVRKKVFGITYKL